MKNKNATPGKFSASDIEDLNAIASIKSGNVQAFATIFKKYKPVLYFSILKKIRDARMAEDLMMEIFEKAFEKLDSYKKEYTFNSWFTRIAHNHIIDYIRKRSVNPVMSKGVSVEAGQMDSNGELQPIEIPSHYNLPMENSEDMRQAARLHYVYDIIKTLPDIDRQVLELYYRDNKACQEVADILGIGLSAAKARIKRAKEFLMVMIDKNKGENFAETTYNWDALA